jgi:DMSO reductase family type II enzyme heme b subunit
MKIKAFAMTLLLTFVPALALASGSAEKGGGIYEKRCAWCHGENGAGDGPSAEFLNPPPRDFTSGVFKWKSTPFDEMAPSDEDIAMMIKGGRAHNSISGWTGMNNTAMPGWADMLSDQDVADLTAYIKKFSEMESPQKPPIDLSGKVKPSKEIIEKGRTIFKDRCSECHGEEGRGDATKKLKDDWGFREWPRDLTKAWTFRVNNDVAEIYTRITVGIPGTQMPSFADPGSNKKLTDEERWAVAAYVNSLDVPYKKPGDNTVISAVRLDGELPAKPDDPAWEKAEYRSFYMVPQIIADERHFTPSLDSVSVKALYNDTELALLLEWDDRTKSLPGDEKSMEIADGEVFADAVAVQWPAAIPRESEKPYFGMGDAALPVNIWHWQSESAAGAAQTVRLIDSKGVKEHEPRDAALAGLMAGGVYDKGIWRVVMKRPLKTNAPDKDIQFEEGAFIPVAFAAWDGSNREKGSRHELTTWYWLLMQPTTGGSVYLWPLIVAAAVAGAEFLWLRSARRK